MNQYLIEVEELGLVCRVGRKGITTTHKYTKDINGAFRFVNMKEAEQFVNKQLQTISFIHNIYVHPLLDWSRNHLITAMSKQTEPYDRKWCKIVRLTDMRSFEGWWCYEVELETGEIVVVDESELC